MDRSFFSKLNILGNGFINSKCKRRSEFVWNDLIKYNLEKVGVLDNMKLKSELKTFSLDETNSIVFDYGY
jgi:hypothetical protein